jgi:hypothetical protein
VTSARKENCPRDFRKLVISRRILSGSVDAGVLVVSLGSVFPVVPLTQPGRNRRRIVMRVKVRLFVPGIGVLLLEQRIELAPENLRTRCHRFILAGK